MRRQGLLLGLVIGVGIAGAGTASHAKKKRRRRPAAEKPAPALEPAAAPASQPVEVVATPLESATVEAVADAAGEWQKLLQEARNLFADLEYGEVVPRVNTVLASEESTIDARMDAYLLLGSSLAIMGNIPEAEKAFRFLLRGRPETDLPADTPPKILRIFRHVKVEDERIRSETRALEHVRVVESLQLSGHPEDTATGGAPIAFAYALRDPRGAVSSVHVQYRKRGLALDYSSLALSLDEVGRWRGEIPGEWTESDDGFALEYYVTTTNGGGTTLLEVGAPPADPLHISIAPGTIADRTPFYEKVWFWAATGAVVVGGGVAGYFLYRDQTSVPDSDLGTVSLD